MFLLCVDGIVNFMMVLLQILINCSANNAPLILYVSKPNPVVIMTATTTDASILSHALIHTDKVYLEVALSCISQ